MLSTEHDEPVSGGGVFTVRELEDDEVDEAPDVRLLGDDDCDCEVALVTGVVVVIVEDGFCNRGCILMSIRTESAAAAAAALPDGILVVALVSVVCALFWLVVVACLSPVGVISASSSSLEVSEITDGVDGELFTSFLEFTRSSCLSCSSSD